MEEDRPGTTSLFGDAIAPGTQRKARATFKRYARKYRFDPSVSYPLRAEANPTMGPILGLKNVISGASGEELVPGTGVAIGTIRMGYGHYRMGLAIASAAHSMGLTPYWFDLLGFDTPGARMIHDLDYWYSLASRLSQKSRLFNKFVWEPLTGKAYKRVEKNYPVMEACRVFSDIYKELPDGMPVIGTHPWTALGALYAGIRNVVNIIPDNCPLGFHLAQGALHSVQSPSNYMGFRTLKDMGPKGITPKGVPASDIWIAGHYIDHELVSNIETDCAARLERARDKAPRRFLISVGGAGAQQQLFVTLVNHMMPMIRAGKVTLFLNFGDHTKVEDLLRSQVSGFDAAATRHSEWAETTAFVERARTEEVSGLHTFLHKDVFAAVYASNLLMRASDVLVTKPSELAYYPIPKLFLQRVGGHEMWGAIRASELGDGTIECTSDALAIQTLDLLALEDDLLTVCCESIRKLNQIGTYNGAYRVVERAMERSRQR